MTVPSALSLVAMLPLGLLALVLVPGWFRRRMAPRTRGAAAQDPAMGGLGTGSRAVLLFDGDRLADSAGLAPGTDLLESARSGRPAALALLGRLFPDLERRLAAGDAAATITLVAESGHARLMVECWGDFTRLTLAAASDPGATLRIASLEDELATLRTIVELCPQPIWREDASARVIWANRAYLDLADRLLPPSGGAASPWPLQPIFGDPGPDATDSLHLPGEQTARRYDILRRHHRDTTTGFASDATRRVAAEEARLAFVQTLTRTFADLRTGLAVFDRGRRLAFFNPAFTDLTGLRPALLARRPHLRSLLDQLREARVIPEPLDWPRWRDRVANLQSRAEEGLLAEDWTLPDGRNWRITGHPHPDGALAFFIEDVTDELALGRHLRRIHEAAHAALDRMPQAVAVFSQGGSMILCNTGYATLWDLPPERPEDVTLARELARWQQASLATTPAAAPATTPAAPPWAQIAGRLASGDRVTPGEFMVPLADGRRLTLHLAPLGGGRVMVEFADRDTEFATDVAADVARALARARDHGALLAPPSGDAAERRKPRGRTARDRRKIGAVADGAARG